MKRRTRLHIETATEYDAFAREVIQSASPSRASVNWAAVPSFYAAVHYVNAYLWETAEFEPRDHKAREEIIATWSALTPALPHYLKLKNYSLNARYRPAFRASVQDVAVLLDIHLQAVEALIVASITMTDTSPHCSMSS